MYLLQQRLRETDTREQNYSRNVKEMGKSGMEEEKMEIIHLLSLLAKESICIIYLKDILI